MLQKWEFKRSSILLALIALSSLSGCASIVNGTSQIVSVETMHTNAAVAGASCKLENDKGVYYVTTPGTVTVHRAYGDMNVLCEKAGVPDGLGVVKSSTKGMMAGNILFGGIIGAGIDAASGAAYDYPTLFRIVMGETTSLPLPSMPAVTPVAVTTATPPGGPKAAVIAE
jgi:uncharacterized protein YceK